jgi:hypothetical protein
MALPEAGEVTAIASENKTHKSWEDMPGLGSTFLAINSRIDVILPR